MLVRASSGSGGGGNCKFEYGLSISADKYINCGFEPLLIYIVWHTASTSVTWYEGTYCKSEVPNKTYLIGSDGVLRTGNLPTSSGTWLRSVDSSGFTIGWANIAGMTIDYVAIG